MAGTVKGANKRKRTYGKDCHQKWGKLGGNPILKDKDFLEMYKRMRGK